MISNTVMGDMSNQFRCERIDDQFVVNAGRPWRLISSTHNQIDRRATLPSIIVLPFASLSSDPEHGYLADGMYELINLLSHSDKWRVMARNTSFRYKDQNIDVRSLADDVGVAYVIDGSIRRVSTVPPTCSLYR